MTSKYRLPHLVDGQFAKPHLAEVEPTGYSGDDDAYLDHGEFLPGADAEAPPEVPPGAGRDPGVGVAEPPLRHEVIGRVSVDARVALDEALVEIIMPSRQ